MTEILGLIGRDWTAGGFVALVILLVLFGGLIPRYVVNQMRVDRDHRLAEKDSEIERWRAAYEGSEAARSAQTDRLDVVVESARTSEQLLRSFRDAAGTVGE